MRKLSISNKYVATIGRLSTRSLAVGEARRKHITKFGIKLKTVLIEDIYDDKGTKIADHQWLDNEFGFTDSDIGKTIEFEATIAPYIKILKTELARDFKLSHVTNVKIEPSSIGEDCGQN